MAEKVRKLGRPRSARSENAILNATMEILVERGYGGLTTDEVVARASASKATIYRRWPSKELLAVAAVDRLPELTPVDKGTIELDLLGIVTEFADFVQNTPLGTVWPMMLGERTRSPELRAALDSSTDRRRAPTRLVLRRAMDRGELPADLDIELAVDLIMGPVILRLMFEDAVISEEEFQKIIHVALKGLGRQYSEDSAPLID
ncbi:TetR/AcrR family transcriptional regulator [Novosphingobium sp. ES2-1]|uniref:TetR/AcrR family transcriptional regulator n=1 Tax=Novosphingobium sp. ES2-1 TaxID=2780074 RepID=UPI00187EEB71|nr:TetR/AcrR family transcriptional regulator [Novosphingobium sp. ES2-1]QOV96449.1 TetR/AcrR family transcriptional regulator [Novosphingobium sp. ES2-1]